MPNNRFNLLLASIAISLLPLCANAIIHFPSTSVSGSLSVSSQTEGSQSSNTLGSLNLTDAASSSSGLAGFGVLHSFATATASLSGGDTAASAFAKESSSFDDYFLVTNSGTYDFSIVLDGKVSAVDGITLDGSFVSGVGPEAYLDAQVDVSTYTGSVGSVELHEDTAPGQSFGSSSQSFDLSAGQIYTLGGTLTAWANATAGPSTASSTATADALDTAYFYVSGPATGGSIQSFSGYSYSKPSTATPSPAACLPFVFGVLGRRLRSRRKTAS